MPIVELVLLVLFMLPWVAILIVLTYGLTILAKTKSSFGDDTGPR